MPKSSKTPSRPVKGGRARGSEVATDVDTSKGSFQREWERGTAIVSWFIATGAFFEYRRDDDVKKSRVKPANIIIVSVPGRGKTELLDRFRPNRCVEYRSDLTVRGLWGILGKAESGLVTHIGATEFQKFFQRKAATADNLFGTMVQAMEEGVDRVDVGSRTLRFNHVRLGIIAAITNGTMDQKQEYLREMGFLSRSAVFPWELPAGEVLDIMQRISDGEVDLSPVRLNLPDRPIAITLPALISRELEGFVWGDWRHEALRVFSRFRQMLMASALLDGRDVVEKKDLDAFHEFDSYWHKMIVE